jgi:hypothetical protein
MSELQNIILAGLKLKGGDVTYNDWEINPNQPFSEQELSFKQDLLQIEFRDCYLVDVGWYPDFDEKGRFMVRVIKNYEWDKPVLRKKVKTFVGLKKCLQEAIDIVDGLINGAIC